MLTAFNAVQLLLAAMALSVIARRLWVLLFEAPLALAAFVAAMEPALARRQFQLARRLAESCAPAWPARLALDAISALEQRQHPRAVVDEALSSSAYDVWKGAGTIATFGRSASPIALIGVILEIGKALRGEGLLGLQRGMALRIAMERSLLTFAIGLGTALVCLAAMTILRRRARILGNDLKRVASLVEQTHRASDDM